MSTSTNEESGPLSYADLRRWLGLVILVVLLGMVIAALESTLLLFAIVILIAMVLNPAIAALEKRGLKRPLAVGVLMVSFVALIAGALWFFVPQLLVQLGELVRQAPEQAGRLQEQAQLAAERYPVLQRLIPQTSDVFNSAGAQAGDVARFLLRSTFSFAGGVVGFAFALLLLLFVLSNPKPLVVGFLELMPNRHREAARRSLVRLIVAMRAWAKGVCINGAIVGVSVGLLTWAIGVQPALIFGAIAFLGEFIPNVGGVIAAMVPLFVALSIGPGTFGLTLLGILFVYQVELNLLVPVILGKEMHLNPVSILFFTLAMGSLFGIAGAILAVPAAAIVKILIEEFYLAPRHLDQAKLEAQAEKIVANEISLKA